MIALSQEERDKFASWLEQEADSNRSMIQQMDKLPMRTKEMEEKFKAEIFSFLIIAKKLRSIETVTVSGTE